MCHIHIDGKLRPSWTSLRPSVASPRRGLMDHQHTLLSEHSLWTPKNTALLRANDKFLNNHFGKLSSFQLAISAFDRFPHITGVRSANALGKKNKLIFYTVSFASFYLRCFRALCYIVGNSIFHLKALFLFHFERDNSTLKSRHSPKKPFYVRA